MTTKDSKAKLKRFGIYSHRFIGIGVRWTTLNRQHRIWLDFPLFSIMIGIGDNDY